MKLDHTAKIGFISGKFDILHAGHIKMLHDAKLLCDRLVVGLSVGSESATSDADRRSVLESIRWVDEVRSYSTNEELVDLIRALMPDLRFVSDSLRGAQFPGFELPIRIAFIEDHTETIDSVIRARIAAGVLEKNMNHDLAPYMEAIRQHLSR